MFFRRKKGLDFSKKMYYIALTSGNVGHKTPLVSLRHKDYRDNNVKIN